MIKFLIRRTLIAIPQLFALSILIFLLASAMPGDALSGEIDPTVTGDTLQHLRDLHGLNDPWYEQYGRWITGIATELDFGKSFQYKMPVIDLIGDRILEYGWAWSVDIILHILTSYSFRYYKWSF